MHRSARVRGVLGGMAMVFAVFASGAGRAEAALMIDDFTAGPLSLAVGDDPHYLEQASLDPAHVIDGQRMTIIKGTLEVDGATVTIDPAADDGRFQFRSATAADATDFDFSYLTITYGSAGQPLARDFTAVASAIKFHNVRSTFGDARYHGINKVHVNALGSDYGAVIPFVESAEAYDLVIPFSAFGSAADLASVNVLHIDMARVGPGVAISFDAVTLVPEPGSAAALLGLGLLVMRRRRGA